MFTAHRSVRRPAQNWLLVLAASLLTLVGCTDAEPNAKPEVIQPVKLHQVDPAGAERIREFPAVVEASAIAQLAFRVGGELDELPVKPGHDVEKGQLIARLDPSDYQLVMDEAQARYDLAASQYNRSKDLVAEGVMSQSQFDEIDSNRNVTKANLETARANLRYTELRAPFAGSIAQVFVENYENIQPQQAIATLQLSDAIDVSIQVPESLFARVQRRDNITVDVVFDASPGQAYSAQLKEWDTTADRATNTYKVVFTLPTPMDINALPGMSATVRVNTLQLMPDARKALIVPASAVFTPPTTELDGERYVWVYYANDQTVELRAVTIGEMTNQGLQILSGIEPGDQVVTAGVHQLTDGQKVRPWQRERGL